MLCQDLSGQLSLFTGRTNAKTIRESYIIIVMSSRTLLLLGVAALVLVTPISISAWRFDGRTLDRVPLPAALHLMPAAMIADFDDDGTQERLTLESGRATIWTESQKRWQSPRDWRVEDARIADLDRDGNPEVVLLVWRPFASWPVDAWLPHGGRIDNFHDSNGMSCHVILIGWKQGSYRELWAGSAMANPVNRLVVADLMGNDRQYLVTLEGEYDDSPSASSRRLKVWEWNGFGFTIVTELEDSFRFIDTAQTDGGQILILAP